MPPQQVPPERAGAAAVYTAAFYPAGRIAAAICTARISAPADAGSAAYTVKTQIRVCRTHSSLPVSLMPWDKGPGSNSRLWDRRRIRKAISMSSRCPSAVAVPAGTAVIPVQEQQTQPRANERLNPLAYLSKNKPQDDEVMMKSSLPPRRQLRKLKKSLHLVRKRRGKRIRRKGQRKRCDARAKAS